MRILITGGKGFLAGMFVKRFRMEHDILALGRNQLNIIDKVQVKNIINEFKPEIVLHLAAIADTGICEKDPELSFEVNVQGSVNIAAACKQIGAKLILMSSEQVYNGNEEAGPYSEDIVAVPNTVYGRDKLKAEEKVREILDECWVLRPTWIFGMPESKMKINSNILFNSIKNIIAGKEFSEPVNEYRGMTYVGEVAENIMKVTDIPYGVYNFGSENNLSRYDIVCLILDKLGRSDLIEDKLVKDTQRYLVKSRDLRISNKKLHMHNIEFSTTKEGVLRALREYSLI